MLLHMIGRHFEAMGVTVVAFGFTLFELKKYTSNFQFTMVMLCSSFLGISMDMVHGTWPVFTTSMFLSGTALISRQAWMQRFTYVNLLWFEPLILFIATGLLMTVLIPRPFDWQLWAMPALPYCFACGLTFGYVEDGLRIRRNTRFGYRIQVGEKAPEIELPDQDGQIVRLSDFSGKHPVLLIFVRGDWCPGCHMMLRTYEKRRHEFLKYGVHVLAIGPDNIDVNRDMVSRLGVGYRLLSDQVQHASSIYGVVYNNPIIEAGVDYAKGIPLPASFLVDIDGTIRYVSRPDRVGEFLSPELIFSALAGLSAHPQPAWN